MENTGRQLSKEQRAALRAALVEFTEDKDRGKAAIFVGRKAELAHVQGCVNRLLRKQGEEASAPGVDLTTVVQGAPGAGKSALLARIREEWPPGGGGSAVAVSLDPGILKLPMPDCLKAVVSRTERVPGLIQVLGKYIQSISVSVAGMADVTVGRDTSRSSTQLPVPVILLFDEIQTELAFSASEQSREHLIQNLRLLHTGEHGAPMFAVYGGLANSADLLKATGLTRLALGSELTLPGFTDDEMDELMTRFVEQYLSSARPAKSTIDRWGIAFRRDSQGWPMHCRNFLIALCEEIRQKDWQPDAADLDTVCMRAQQLRFIYYAQRMQGGLQNRYVLISKVLEEMGQLPMSDNLIMAAIDRARRDSLPEDFGMGALPEGMTIRQTFDAMLHAGVVQKTIDGSGRLVCPIPSLAGYIAARATLPPGSLHDAVLVENPKEIEQAIQQCRGDEERGKRLQATDMRGRTPLMLAVELGMVAMVEYLVQAESRLPAALRSTVLKDNRGCTAQDYAEASDDVRMVELLRRIQP